MILDQIPQIECPNCNRKISRAGFEVDGFDAVCDVCTERALIDFMATYGVQQGLTCDSNCACQNKPMTLDQLTDKYGLEYVDYIELLVKESE